MRRLLLTIFIRIMELLLINLYTATEVFGQIDVNGNPKSAKQRVGLFLPLFMSKKGYNFRSQFNE